MSALSVALDRLASGGMIILVDDEDRENEGDLVCAAEFATPEVVNFMSRYGRGLICLSLTPEHVDHLGLQQMVATNRTARQTGFTVSIEARTGVTTGISAFDRARTIEAAIADGVTGADIVSPGHVFPLRAVPGGCLQRDGHTEASIDLARMAGLKPAAVICEILKDDGTMARRADLDVFAAKHDLPILSIKALIEHRWSTETLVEEVADARLPIRNIDADFRILAFRNRVDGSEHVAITLGEIGPGALVRVHSECLTGDAMGSLRCDCGDQLNRSLGLIAAEGAGAVVYVRGHEGRGIGLANKIRAYALQDAGCDTVDANLALGLPVDGRDYAAAAQIIRALGAPSIRLLSNNPRKVEALSRYGVEIVDRVPLKTPINAHCAGYLSSKRKRLGHDLDVEAARVTEPSPATFPGAPRALNKSSRFVA